MSSENFKKLEKSWNISHRIMLSLPRTAHRYLLEPLTKKEHIIKSLKKRFIVFLSKLKSSKKKLLGNVLNTIEQDCGSTTGKNIRNMMLQEIRYDLKSAPYVKLPDVDTWRVNIIQEIIDIMSGTLRVDNFHKKHLQEICDIVSSN